MISYEYMQFLNEKVMEYLPPGRVVIGNKINFKCPICGDSKKNVNKKRGWFYRDTCSFYCFNCGTGMSGIKFLQIISGQDYADIKREYIRLFLKSDLHTGLSAHYEQPSEEPSIFDLKPIVKPEWKLPLTENAKKYLENRKVLSAPFLRDPLYSCNGKNNSEYIMIPWTVNGVDAYYQLNDFMKYGQLKYIFPRNKHKLVYGLDNIDLAWNKIIIFEGVYDSLFVKNAVAVGTKSVTDYQMKLIRERYPNHQICISFDNDQPGLQSMSKIIESGKDVKFFKWFGETTEAKDINEQILKTGDVNIFSNPAQLEPMIMTPLQLKMWLIQSGNWNVRKKSPVAAAMNRRGNLKYGQSSR